MTDEPRTERAAPSSGAAAARRDGPRADDGWRWFPEYHDEPGYYSIDVIEPAQENPTSPNAHRVPFGFGVRPAPVAEEWEGNPS